MISKNKPGKIRRKSIREKIFERDEWKCKYCGLDMKQLYQDWKDGKIKRKHALITIDHIKPKIPGIRGKDWSEGNLTTACKPCNNRKGGWLEMIAG